MFQEVGGLIDGGDAPRQVVTSNMLSVGGYTEGLEFSILFRDGHLKLVRLRLGQLAVNGNSVVEASDQHGLQYRVEHLVILMHPRWLILVNLVWCVCNPWAFPLTDYCVDPRKQQWSYLRPQAVSPNQNLTQCYFICFQNHHTPKWHRM